MEDNIYYDIIIESNHTFEGIFDKLQSLPSNPKTYNCHNHIQLASSPTPPRHTLLLLFHSFFIIQLFAYFCPSLIKAR